MFVQGSVSSERQETAAKLYSLSSLNRRQERTTVQQTGVLSSVQEDAYLEVVEDEEMQRALQMMLGDEAALVLTDEGTAITSDSELSDKKHLLPQQ